MWQGRGGHLAFSAALGRNPIHPCKVPESQLFQSTFRDDKMPGVYPAGIGRRLILQLPFLPSVTHPGHLAAGQDEAGLYLGDRSPREAAGWRQRRGRKRTQGTRRGTAGYVAGVTPRLTLLPEYLPHGQPRQGAAAAANGANSTSNSNKDRCVPYTNSANPSTDTTGKQQGWDPVLVPQVPMPLLEDSHTSSSWGLKLSTH